MNAHNCDVDSMILWCKYTQKNLVNRVKRLIFAVKKWSMHFLCTIVSSRKGAKRCAIARGLINDGYDS